MLSEYQLKIVDLHNVRIDNVKKLVPNFFDKEKYEIHYENTLSIQTRIETKNTTSHIRIQSITIIKTIYSIQHIKKNRNKKKTTKMEKRCNNQ